jgi:hypothetical protein
LLLTALAAGGTPAAPADPLAFLRETGGFVAEDLALLERGQPVARVLHTDRREVAVVGAVRIHAPVDRILAHYRDVSLLGRSTVVEQVGTFSSPPRPSDLDTLVMEDYDLQTIRECTPGDCGVRLSAADMERFTRDVNWNAADWRTAAGNTWRRMLAEYAAGYLSRGKSSLSEYRNKDVPLSVAQELDLLFDEAVFFNSAAPAFMQYVRNFPGGRLEGTDQLLYWTKDDFGIRPVFSITQLLLHKAPAGQPRSAPLALVAAKQIYATHYFDGGLGLTAAYAHPSGGVYLIAENRARTRSLTGFMRGFARSAVRKGSREAMEKVLRSTKNALEQSR